jgi:hypothetical protein
MPASSLYSRLASDVPGRGARGVDLVEVVGLEAPSGERDLAEWVDRPCRLLSPPAHQLRGRQDGVPTPLRVKESYGRARRRRHRTGTRPTHRQSAPRPPLRGGRTTGHLGRGAPGPHPPPGRRVGAGQRRGCGGGRAAPGRLAHRAVHRRADSRRHGRDPDRRRDPARHRRRAAHGRGRHARRAHRQHPHGPVGPHRPRPGLHARGQAGALQPGRIVEGPHRARHDPSGRAGRPAPTRCHHRGAHEREHRRGARHRGGPARLRLHLRLPRQGGAREDRPTARLWRRGRRLSHVGATGAPRVVLLGLGPPGPGGALGVEAGPVPQPRQSPVPARHHRGRDLGADPGPRHPLRGRHRHGGNRDRHRPLSQGTEPRRPGHRGRSRRLGVLGGIGAALSGGGHRRGLLAHDLRPLGRGPGGGDLRRPELRHGSAGDARRGVAPRRVGGDRRGGGARRRARPSPRRRRRGAHPRLGARLSVQDLQRCLDGRLRLPPGGGNDRGGSPRGA